jgi:hypothetical protein
MYASFGIPVRTCVPIALMMSLSTGLAATGAKAQPAPYADIAVSWAAGDNLYGEGFRFRITLENRGDRPLPAGGWELYFNMMRMLDTEQVPASIRLEHINGQFYPHHAHRPVPLVEPSRLEYMAFPRILALAERAWSPQPAWALVDDRPQREQALRKAWNEFANRLGQRELPRLDHLHGGIGYRIPVAGGVIEGGVLHANVSYPGMAIHYTTDGRSPTPDSPRYEGPVHVDGPVSLRVFDTRGRGGRAVTLPETHGKYSFNPNAPGAESLIPRSG